MKLSKAFTTIFSLLLFSVGTQAQSLSSEHLLERDLMISSKVLTNEILIYNYFHLQQVWPELQSSEGRRNYIQRYLSARAGDFWDLSFTDNNPKFYAAGPALYFAIDPLISKSFGNTFIELRIPAGTRFINVVSPLPLKKDTLAALEQEGYISRSDIPSLFPKQTGFYRDTLRMMVLLQYGKFRELIHRIFARNHIQFIEYNFNSSLSVFCSKHSYSAFAYIGEYNSIDPKNAIVATPFQDVMMYSTELQFPNATASELDSRARILKFRNVLEEVNSRVTKQKAQVIQTYILSQYTTAEYDSLKKTTYSCQ